MLIAWSHGFLSGILSDAFFSKTVRYSCNSFGTNLELFTFSTDLISLGASGPSSFDRIKSIASLHSRKSSSFSLFCTYSHNSHLVTALFFNLSCAFFCRYSFACLPHDRGQCIMDTIPVSQSTSGLCFNNHVMPNINSFFPRLHTSKVAFSVWKSCSKITATSCVISPFLFHVPSTFC